MWARRVATPRLAEARKSDEPNILGTKRMLSVKMPSSMSLVSVKFLIELRHDVRLMENW